MNINLIEMEGLLRGKCLPGDLLTGETLAEYLVRQFAKLNEQLTESRREFTAANATIHNLELKVAQVVAENAALKAFGTKLDEMHNDLNGEGTGIQGRAEVVCQQVALEAAMEEFDAIKTPATDAYLAEVLAHGVEMFAGELTGNFQQCTDDEFIREAAKRFAIGAKRFAAQLRQGAEQ